MRQRLLPAYVGAAALILSATVPVTAQEGNAKDRVCRKVKQEITTYDWNVVKFVFSGFGLFGSTRSCHKTIMKTTIYCDAAPPKEKPKPRPLPTEMSASGPGSVSARAAIQPINDDLILRTVSGQAPCYSSCISQNPNTTIEQVDFIGIDGRVLNLSFTPKVQPLSYFLGDNFDPSGYCATSGSWHGFEVEVPRSYFVQPTLEWSSGAQDPNLPIAALMDISAPDQKGLRATLGDCAANALVTVLVSATPPTDGPLLQLGSVTVPIVYDSWTTLFLNNYPQLTQPADASGTAQIPFPLLSHPALEGEDFYMAAVAHDPGTGNYLCASTWSLLRLRNLTLCAE